MIELKNVRPGVLMIADGPVRLEPGQVVAVKSLTAQMEKALSLGMLARVEAAKVTVTAASLVNLSEMTEKQARAIISKETDPNRLKAFMEREKRTKVLDAISYRIAEVTGGPS